MRGDHPNYSIVEIGQKTKKSPGDMRRLVVTQTPVENHRLTLVGKNSQKKKIIEWNQSWVFSTIDFGETLVCASPSKCSTHRGRSLDLGTFSCFLNWTFSQVSNLRTRTNTSYRHTVLKDKFQKCSNQWKTRWN